MEQQAGGSRGFCLMLWRARFIFQQSHLKTGANGVLSVLGQWGGVPVLESDGETLLQVKRAAIVSLVFTSMQPGQSCGASVALGCPAEYSKG